MAEIELHGKNVSGLSTLVDDEDYEYLSQFKWYMRRDRLGLPRVTRGGGGRNIQMTRDIMKVTDPKLVVDHINHDTLDNRKENLRVCTATENARNCSKPKNNTSGYKGVSRIKHTLPDSKKWQVCISVDNKSIYIGSYHDIHEAAQAYNEAAIKHHGEFAALNEVNSTPEKEESVPDTSEVKWVPEEGDIFYYIHTNGSICKDMVGSSDWQDEMIKFGNCFKTSEEARKMRDKIKAILEGK